jgi:L-cystine transport system ATP-binding protein
MIILEGIEKSFGKFKVLRNINIRVNKCEVVCVLGPSGSGKTTMLRAINFLEPADKGIITIDDLSVDVTKATQADIRNFRCITAMVFQQSNIFINRTAIGNVMEGLVVVQKMNKKEAYDKALFYLEKVHMQDKINSYPNQLSGGQQQRVGIARALALNPKVLLFDEPTSSLDPELVNEVLSVMREIAQEGITMIVVTHEMSFARDVANWVVFMDDGLVVEKGKPDDIFDNPREERTKKFIKKV